jgi:hypothetical protein
MATLSVQDATSGLQSITMSAASGGGDQIPQGTKAGWRLPVFLLVRNADTTATNVTVNGVVYAVPANTGTAVIPVYGIYYGDLKSVTYSKVTSLTVAAVKV